MEFVKLENGETIAYRTAGKGDKTLLAIHGNFGSSLHFRRLIDAPPAGYRVILPDLRGFGESTYNTRITCLKDLAEDMSEFCDKLGIKTAAVLGWSLGGGVAMELAVLRPELVEKLFLMNSTSCYGYPLFRQDETGAYIPFTSPEDLLKNPGIAMLLSSQKSGIDTVYRSTVKLPFKDKDEEDEFIGCFMKQKNLLDADWALAVFNMTDKPSLYSPGSDTIKNISCPIVLTTGDRDLMVPYNMVQQNIEAFLGKARLIVYEDCGHSPIIEKTERLLKDLGAFLAE